jgi:hypothetical protein
MCIYYIEDINMCPLYSGDEGAPSFLLYTYRCVPLQSSLAYLQQPTACQSSKAIIWLSLSTLM